MGPTSSRKFNSRGASMSKSDKTVVITGATSGIGLGLAEAFLKEGYNVVGTGPSTERLQATAAKLDAGDRFLGVAGDVGKPEAATNACSPPRCFTRHDSRLPRASKSR